MLITKNNIDSLNLTKEEILDQGATFLIDKDLTWTSNDVVSKFRSMFKTKKVGHAGSLDPFATGLLIVSLGKDTKKINDYSEYSKDYKAWVKLGAETKSYDAEHPEINLNSIKHIDIEKLSMVLESMTGKTQQTAPIYSAKKHQGKRHYELARQNKEVVPKIKEVEIYSLKLLDVYLPFCEIDVSCSKGTYIRSMAYEIGKKMDVGGYLFQLKRTRIGDFMLQDALKIKDIIKYL